MEKDFQRTAKRKVELLLQLIKGEATLVDVRREHDLKQSDVEGLDCPRFGGRLMTCALSSGPAGSFRS